MIVRASGPRSPYANRTSNPNNFGLSHCQAKTFNRSQKKLGYLSDQGQDGQIGFGLPKCHSGFQAPAQLGVTQTKS